jgi:hypothetical protein
MTAGLAIHQAIKPIPAMDAMSIALQKYEKNILKKEFRTSMIAFHATEAGMNTAAKMKEKAETKKAKKTEIKKKMMMIRI